MRAAARADQASQGRRHVLWEKRNRTNTRNKHAPPPIKGLWRRGGTRYNVHDKHAIGHVGCAVPRLSEAHPTRSGLGSLACFTSLGCARSSCTLLLLLHNPP